MLFGTNLRVESLDYVLEKRPCVDVFEIIVDNWLSPGPHHRKLKEVRDCYDVSFHCLGMNIAGHDPISYEYLRRVKALAMEFRPLHISDHLCFSRDGGVHHHDLLPVEYTKKSLDNSALRLQAIQDYLGEEILLENLSYYIEFNNSQYSESEFLSELVSKTGCSLLLDFNNHWVNAQNFKRPFLDQFRDLPLDKVKEVHVAGAEKFDELYIDTHGGFVETEVLNALKNLLPSLQGVPIIYERDQNISSHKDLYSELSRIKSALYD